MIETATPRWGWWRDALAIIVLLAVVVAAWCGANAMSSRAAWTLPTAYLEPIKGDIIHYEAMIRAASRGNFIPFGSKIVPELGAPNDGNWNDWPWIEEIPVAALGLIASGTDIFTALNVFLLLGHLSAALSFYLVARALRAGLPWAFVGGLAFGLAPYAFLQSPHHPMLLLYWHIPLFVVVWRWVSREPGIALGSRPFWLALAVGFAAGLQMVYYTAIFCQLTLLGALVTLIRSREIRPFLSAVLVVLAAAVAFALMNADTWAYQMANGSNPGALVREYKWLEIYGLKVVDLFLPPITHQGAIFRAFAEGHARQAVLQDEGSYLGLIGVGSLLFLVFVAVRAVVRRQPEQIPLEAWQVLWIVLYFSTGGLNAISGVFGITVFRAACRYSIVILAIVLIFAARRVTRARLGTGPAAVAIAVALSLIILWDQVPRAPEKTAVEAIARQVESDRKFAGEMEAALPKGAMVFQIPVMEFPESPAPGVPPYDHFRPYLYTDTLRYSFGSMKGREREQWQQEVAKMQLADAVAEMRKRGFSALYINRNGFPEKAQAIEDALASMGHRQKIVSDTGDLSCVIFSAGEQDQPIRLFP